MVKESVDREVMPAEQEAGAEPPEGGEVAQEPTGRARSEQGGQSDEEGPPGVEVGQEPLEDDVPKRVARDPGAPTQSERDEHCVDHWPFRSWCEDCVRGRATGEQHKASEQPRSIPVISFDYLFITRGWLLRREELEGTEDESVDLKILVVKDSRTKSVFAHVVDRKGTDSTGYAITRLVEDIAWLGHVKVVLKADNERAIVKLLRESLRAAKTEVQDLEQIGAEFPSAYDSKSNGEIENTIRNLQGLMRTMKLGLERRLNVTIPHTHALMSWLAEHVAWTMTTRPKGEDGLTAYQRVKGTPFTKRLLEFGEKILYKLPTKGPRHDATGKLAERWSYGFFLGFSRLSNDYLVWTADGAVKARCQQRLTIDRRWPAGGLEAVNAGAHVGYAPRVPERFSPGEAQAEQPVAEGRGPQAVQIRQTDWLQHGSTPGCGKCMHATLNGWGKAGGPHSGECVARFRKLFMETDAGRARVERADMRARRREPQEQGGEAEVVPERAPTVAPPMQAEAEQEDGEATPRAHRPEDAGGQRSHEGDAEMGGDVTPGGAGGASEDIVPGGADDPMDHRDGAEIGPVMSMFLEK